MFDGKMKAVTFSYDDAPFQDRRLVEIFNKYGLKCTFNVNTGLFGCGHRTIMPEEMPALYRGHEIAVHTVTHPHLEQIDEDERIVSEIENDRKRLEEIMGYPIIGMAYPFGTYNDKIVDLMATRTGVKYSRTTKATFNFDTQTDLLRFHPTCHHKTDRLFDLARNFIEMKPDKPQVFYIWGHSYEFDREEGQWERFEEFCKLISGHDDIFYGTNSETLIK
ncbi:MAG: polysaccharide deacetylase [Ruminococcaceae bacterium]|nr:polysaccharide deacetylase [Oscillospiraceae bacterium]